MHSSILKMKGTAEAKDWKG